MTRSGADDPLVRRFLEHDADAVAALQSQVARVVRFRGYEIPSEDRRDIAQETMVHLWREVNKPDFAFSEDLLAFARLLAYRRCLDWRRANHPMAPVGEHLRAPQAEPHQLLIQTERRVLGRRVLARLGASCRELIYLHIHRAMKYRDLAKRLGRTEGALRTQMWHCLKQARDLTSALQQPRLDRRRQ